MPEITISGGGLKNALTVKFSLDPAGGKSSPVSGVIKKSPRKMKPITELKKTMADMLKGRNVDQQGTPFVRTTTEPYH